MVAQPVQLARSTSTASGARHVGQASCQLVNASFTTPARIIISLAEVRAKADAETELCETPLRSVSARFVPQKRIATPIFAASLRSLPIGPGVRSNEISRLRAE